jgi:hypothetical protein
MKWLVENWSLLIVVASVITYMLISGKKSVKEWLLYGVFMAESEWGSGTGKLKLRTVYDMFVTKYPIISKIIPFVVFSLWVDEVLKEMKKILEENESIKNQLITKE